jgi:hypothetical protein
VCTCKRSECWCPLKLTKVIRERERERVRCHECEVRGAVRRNKNINTVDPARNFLAASVSNASGIAKYEGNFCTQREFRVYSETD